MINRWDKFRKDKLKKIFTEKNIIIDIGGGLRIDADKNNCFDKNNQWLLPLIRKVDYKILDKVDEYNPDIVGDIHNLPMGDNTVDAIICIAVLEHVENPQKAVSEMFRVLKHGGYCFIYVPFLYYYHPMKNYYKDFYRFTKDGIEYLTRDFKSVEIQNVRGSVSSLVNLVPFFSKKTKLFDFIDRLFGKSETNQTSGHDIFCEK